MTELKGAPEIAPRISTFFLRFLSIVVMCIPILLSARGRITLQGDAKEYIIQTQALAFDWSASITYESRVAHWNATNPFGDFISNRVTKDDGRVEQTTGKIVAKQAPGRVGGLYLDRFGSYRFYHWISYPLVAAPFVGIASIVSTNTYFEYASFHLVNVAFIALPFLILFAQGRSLWCLFVCALCISTTPLIPYATWATPEVMCWSLIFTAFLVSSRPTLGALCLGFAATQNLPSAIFFVPYVHLLPASRRLSSLGAGCSVFIGSLLYFYWYFGTPSLISSLGFADNRYISGSRVFDLFFHPIQGAVWYYSGLCCFALVLSPALPRSRTITLWSTIIVAAAGCCATANFHSAQLGAMRYATWLLAPVLPIVLTHIDSMRIRTRALTLAAVLSLTFWTGSLPLAWMDIRSAISIPHFSKWLMERTRYVGDIETVTELALGRELLKPWNFAEPFSVDFANHTLWIVPSRAKRDLQRLTKLIPAEVVRGISADSVLPRRNVAFGDYYTVWVAK